MDRFQVLAALSETRIYSIPFGIFQDWYGALPPVFLGLAVVTTSSALFRPDVVFPQEHFAPRRNVGDIGGSLCTRLPEDVKKSPAPATFLRVYSVHFTRYSLERLRDAKRFYEKTTTRRSRDARQELHHAERAGAPQR